MYTLEPHTHDGSRVNSMSMSSFLASSIVCDVTPSGATMRAVLPTDICFIHSSCISVLPRPQSAKIALLPRLRLFSTMSFCQSYSTPLIGERISHTAEECLYVFDSTNDS